jgi:hypothetical protein
VRDKKSSPLLLLGGDFYFYQGQSLVILDIRKLHFDPDLYFATNHWQNSPAKAPILNAKLLINLQAV